MLKKIAIRNFILIESLEIEFSPGLNIMSGETGGGKSVIAAAIDFLSGGRARIDYIRRGRKGSCVVEGVFVVEGGGSSGQIVVRRQMDSTGKTRAWIDDQRVGVKKLREIMEGFVCLTSQHEQVKLLRASTHRELLDQFAGTGELFADYRKLFDEMKRWTAKLGELKGKFETRQERVDILKHKINEIKLINPQPGEDERIKAKIAMVKNKSRILQVIGYTMSELFDGQDSALEKVAGSIREMKKIESISERYCQLLSLLEEVQVLLNELDGALRSEAEALEFDMSEFDSIQSRLFAIEKLKRRYGCGIDEILNKMSEMQREVELLENLDFNLKEAEQNVERIKHQVVEKAGKISEVRTAASQRLRKAVMKELAELAFERCDFDISIISRSEVVGSDDPVEYLDESGADEVEFLFKPNKGEEFAPLARIASGGELSRVLLALKMVGRRQAHGKETFIFDEVDAGIGGAVAEYVGRKLYQLGRFNQVICITHLPQIAAFGSRHLYVYKRQSGGRTVIDARFLESWDDRVREIARMICGKQITKKGRDAAEELLLKSGVG